ncbi:hypothetical protein BH10BAC5_BH10BAC5_02580 [soil metagenome]
MTIKQIWITSLSWQIILYIIILCSYIKPEFLIIFSKEVFIVIVTFSIGVLCPISILLILKRNYFLRKKTNKFSLVIFFLAIFIFTYAVIAILPTIILACFAFYIFTLVFTYKVAFLINKQF